MEHRQLINFVTVCEEKNISRAAARLFISQQGLSKSIGLLEESLGVQLFSRTHWGIELTEFGAALEKTIRPYLKQHDRIVTEILRLREKEPSRVSIGMTIGSADFLPPFFFQNFLLACPGIHFELNSFTDDDCLKSVLDYRIHLGFSSGPIDFNFFDSLWSYRHRLFLVAGTGHPLAKRSSIKLKDLQNETIITLNNRVSSQLLLQETCGQYGIKPAICLGGAETNLMRELCGTNRMVSFFAGPMEKQPGIVKIEIEDIDLYWEFHLVINKYASVDGGVKAFIDYALANLEKG
jgi:DNA-binding transcriptional LysR family regulator